MRLHSKKLAIGNDTNESVGQKSASTGKLMSHSGTNMKYSIKERLYDVREMIDNHVENIHSSVTDNVKQTIKFVQNVQHNNAKLMKPNTKRQQKIKLDPSFLPVRRLWDQVASGESTESDFDVTLNYQQPQMQQFEQSARIVDQPRLTKGEEVEFIVPQPKPIAIFVNSKVDRFKRQDHERAAVN